MENFTQLFQANLEYKYLLIQPDVGLFFPAVDFVANKISEIADERGDDGEIPLVLDCQRFRGIDYTAVKVRCTLFLTLYFLLDLLS